MATVAVSCEGQRTSIHRYSETARIGDSCLFEPSVFFYFGVFSIVSMCRYECLGSIVLIFQDIGDKIRSGRQSQALQGFEPIVPVVAVVARS